MPEDHRTRWFPEDPSKAWAERFYLAWTPVWMGAQTAVQLTGWYRGWGDLGHLGFSLAIFLPLWLLPLLIPARVDRDRPLAERTVFKVNLWLAIFAFLQSYFGTHYFFRVLGMHYDFPVALELSGVPFMLYLQAFTFFSTYLVLMNLIWRRFHSAGRRSPLASLAVLVALGFAMAFGETFAMANPALDDVFRYADRSAMLRYGSIFYGGLFVIGLPFWFRIDERMHSPTPLGRVAVEALAANMLMLLWYDAWRLLLGPLVAGLVPPQGPPFIP